MSAELTGKAFDSHPGLLAPITTSLVSQPCLTLGRPSGGLMVQSSRPPGGLNTFLRYGAFLLP